MAALRVVHVPGSERHTPHSTQALDFEPLIREHASCFCWEVFQVWAVKAALQEALSMGWGWLQPKHTENCVQPLLWALCLL